MADAEQAVPTPEEASFWRNKLSKFVNLGICVAGIIFIITGVLKSTLLLYVGCAVSLFELFVCAYETNLHLNSFKLSGL